MAVHDLLVFCSVGKVVLGASTFSGQQSRTAPAQLQTCLACRAAEMLLVSGAAGGTAAMASVVSAVLCEVFSACGLPAPSMLAAAPGWHSRRWHSRRWHSRVQRDLIADYVRHSSATVQKSCPYTIQILRSCLWGPRA